MILPNKYELHNKVRPVDLIKAGFEYRRGLYCCKHTLCPYIYVDIEIDLHDKWMRYFVKNKGIETYFVPFYLENQRINNILYPKVVTEFNQYMDGLCDSKIMWRKGYINKLNRQHKKQRDAPLRRRPFMNRRKGQCGLVL